MGIEQQCCFASYLYLGSPISQPLLFFFFLKLVLYFIRKLGWGMIHLQWITLIDGFSSSWTTEQSFRPSPAVAWGLHTVSCCIASPKVQVPESKENFVRSRKREHWLQGSYFIVSAKFSYFILKEGTVGYWIDYFMFYCDIYLYMLL